MTTAGRPGIVTPYTSSRPGTTRCTSYQIDGSVRSRCGSPASNAWPVALRFGITAQLLLALHGASSSSARASWRDGSHASTAEPSSLLALSGAPGGGTGDASNRGAL